MAAGLFSRAVWYFQAQKWNNAVGGDASEVGSGPGSYDIDESVWHVNVSDLALQLLRLSLTSSSLVTQNSMGVAAGVYLMPFSDGRTLQPMALSYPITATGLPSSLCSSCCGTRRPRAIFHS